MAVRLLFRPAFPEDRLKDQLPDSQINMYHEK